MIGDMRVPILQRVIQTTSGSAISHEYENVECDGDSVGDGDGDGKGDGDGDGDCEEGLDYASTVVQWKYAVALLVLSGRKL